MCFVNVSSRNVISEKKKITPKMQSIYFSIYLSIFLSVYLYIYLSIHSSIYLYICMLMRLLLLVVNQESTIHIHRLTYKYIYVYNTCRVYQITRKSHKICNTLYLLFGIRLEDLWWFGYQHYYFLEYGLLCLHLHNLVCRVH